MPMAEARSTPSDASSNGSEEVADFDESNDIFNEGSDEGSEFSESNAEIDYESADGSEGTELGSEGLQERAESSETNVQSKRPRLDTPGAFASSSCSHNSKFCRHPFAVPEQNFGDVKDRGTACATAHLLHALPESLGRWAGAGTKHEAELLGKSVAFQTVIHPALPKGLYNATARLLGTSVNSVRRGLEIRGNKSNTAMNAELRNGAYGKRRRRGDKYDRTIVYNFFHHEGSLPDFSSMVEPDKNVRMKWKKKKWSLGGETVKLNCDMRVRKGTKGELAEDYLNSETHARSVLRCL